MNTRAIVQTVSTFLTNAYLKGFWTGKIFVGASKHICVPSLNCYSCPGAMFACPVGAAQVVLAGGGGLDPTAPRVWGEKITTILSGTPVFVIGFLSLIGAFFGRASCGWVCPFGFFQELIHRIPGPKPRPPKVLRWMKYVVLLVFVILMPLLLTDKLGFSEPYFCELICPAGTLEGGIFLPLLNSDLRGLLGKLFLWKFSLLIGLIYLMVLFRRPFCAWLCPLGAFLAPFNLFSIGRVSLDAEECVNCGLCDKVCPAQLDVRKEIDGLDCIRCLECGEICPKKIIQPGFSGQVVPKPAPKPASSSDLN